MIQRVLFAAACVFTLACGSTPSEDTATDAGTTPEVDAGTVEADAGITSFTVHVRGARQDELFVMLGSDPAGPSGKTVAGDITFDVSPPQDVTVVGTSEGRTTVLTVRGVEAPELTVLWPARPAGNSGVIKGTLSQSDAAAKAWAMTAQFENGGRARSRSVNQGAFTLNTRNSGDFWISGYEADGTGALARPLRAGLNRGALSLSPGGAVDDAAIALTHPFDQKLPVTVANASDFAFPAFGGGVFYDFKTSSGKPMRVTFPGLSAFLGGSGEIAALARTAPFDDCTNGVAVGAQDSGGTSAHIKNGLTSLTETVEVRPLGFVALTMPGSAVTPEQLEVSWLAPEVRTAEAMLLVNGPKDGLNPGEPPVLDDQAGFVWIVMDRPSASAKSFKPFRLPAESGAPATIPGGAGCSQGRLTDGCYQLYLFAIDDSELTWSDVTGGKVDFFHITERPDVRISIAETDLSISASPN